MAFASGREEKARCQGKANLNGKLAALGLAPKGALAAVGVAWQQLHCYRACTCTANDSEHEDDDSFWSLVRGRGEKECLQTIEVCMDAIRNHANHVQSQMEVYRSNGVYR